MSGLLLGRTEVERTGGNARQARVDVECRVAHPQLSLVEKRVYKVMPCHGGRCGVLWRRVVRFGLVIGRLCALQADLGRSCTAAKRAERIRLTRRMSLLLRMFG